MMGYAKVAGFQQLNNIGVMLMVCECSACIAALINYVVFFFFSMFTDLFYFCSFYFTSILIICCVLMLRAHIFLCLTFLHHFLSRAFLKELFECFTDSLLYL